MYHTAKCITGSRVSAADGEVGKVYDLYFDNDSWEIRYVAVDTGAWLEGRCVWGSPMAIDQIDWDNRVIHVKFTKEHIQGSPDIDLVKPDVLRQLDEHRKKNLWPAFRVFPMSSGYFGPGYPFNSPGTVGLGLLPGRVDDTPDTAIVAPPEPAPEKEEVEIPLRSASQVEGYKIAAYDGNVGHVQNLLIDDETWKVAHLIVGTGNWLSGKVVLMPVQMITNVDWMESAVDVCATLDQVKACPEYDDSVPLTREYESKLFEHYGRPKPWE